MHDSSPTQQTQSASSRSSSSVLTCPPSPALTLPPAAPTPDHERLTSTNGIGSALSEAGLTQSERLLAEGPSLFWPASPAAGLPTPEIIYSYPVMFSWDRLKEIIRTGDLGELKRPPDLQKTYDLWCNGIKAQYNGSTEKYILTKRIHFSAPPREGEAFHSKIENGQFCLAANDWPYSTPRDVVHILIWSQLPLMQPDQITDRINEDGVYGFTGTSTELPDKGSPGSPQYELGQFVRDRWPEDKWETAWFMNPPRLQSVKLLPHYHVFARRISEEVN